MAGYDLRNEEEVKEYITNLGIEYQFSCFHEKSSTGCQLLGDYLDAIKRDFTRAGKVYKLNCDEYSHGKSCYNFAAFNQLGKGCERNDEEALKYHRRGCQLNYPGSCLLAGAMMTDNHEDSKRYHQGLAYLDKGCQGDNAESCFRISGEYFAGVGQIMDADQSKSFKYAERACSLGHIQGCANLSYMYKTGKGTSQNKDLALKYQKLAIEMRDEFVKEKRQIQFG